MLAAWRDDLAEDLPTVRTPAMPAPATEVAPRRRSRARLVAAVAAGVVALGGVTTAAASVAGPDSPLWPVTRALFPERADSRVAQQQAEQTIEQAREAVEQSRYSDAEKLLDEATAIIGRIGDTDLARTLLAEVEAIRGLLPGLGGPGSGPSSGPSGGPGSGPGGVPQPTPSPTRAGAGGGSEPGTGGGGLPLPTLPDLPLPTPSLPLPSLPLPSLPLPTDILP
jgi:hypothetical protein